jgi:hypothetical protein
MTDGLAPSIAPDDRLVTFVASDGRADGGTRRVTMAAKSVRIARRRDGVTMRIAVPYANFRGLALAMSEAQPARFALVLIHDDGDLCVPLAILDDETRARRLWQGLSRRLTVPRLVAREAGFRALDERTGTILHGVSIARRRGSLVRNRRPSFGRRRRPGDLARTANRFAGEREIVCYE